MVGRGDHQDEVISDAKDRRSRRDIGIVVLPQHDRQPTAASIINNFNIIITNIIIDHRAGAGRLMDPAADRDPTPAWPIPDRLIELMLVVV